MAITLESNYSKKLGLPGYSSHQYSVTLRTEVADLNQVEAESARLHALLQASVDREIQKVGYLPATTAGSVSNKPQAAKGEPQKAALPSAHPSSNSNGYSWACSPKQREYILKLTTQHELSTATVEALALERFSKQLSSLNKLEASSLIEELKTLEPRRPTAGQPAGAR